jgi:hypothetical protein
MAVFPNLMYRVNAIPIRTLAIFFDEIDKLVPKIICKRKGPRVATTNLKKNNEVGRFAPFVCKIY